MDDTNQKSRTWMWVVAIIVVILGIYFFTRGASTPSTDSTQGTQTSATGHVVFSVTDAAANMGLISEVNMKINKVEMHNTVDGWVTVSTTAKTYSLLALNAAKRSEVLAEVNASAGTYDQLRLSIDSASVQTKAGLTREVTLPSDQITIDTTLVVKANQTTSASFDFIADKSLFTTAKGEYVFAPVVKTTTRSGASVIVNADSSVLVTGGQTDDVNTVGMDLDGTIKLDFQLDTKKSINLNTDGSIKVDGALELK